MRRSLRPAHATDEEDALASLQSRETLETPIDEEAKQGRNTPEFNYALDSLPVEKFPTYVREFDNILTFPEKLMLMFEYIERMCSNSAQRYDLEPIQWTRCGTAFVVRDSLRLCETWLPRFFGSAKYPSFTRRLYRYGFCKMFPGKYGFDNELHLTVFAHEHFLRDQKTVLWRIQSTAKRSDNQLQRSTTSPAETLSPTSIPVIASISNSISGRTPAANQSTAAIPPPPLTNRGTHSFGPNNPGMLPTTQAPRYPIHPNASLDNSLVTAWLQHQLSTPLPNPPLTQEEMAALIAVLLLQQQQQNSR